MSSSRRAGRSRLTVRDLILESLAGILQRPGRTVLTMLGTVLGVGAFVAVLGLTATATGQISQRFNALVATEVVVKVAQDADQGGGENPFPQDAEKRAASLRGVNHAGVAWPLPDNIANTLRRVAVPGDSPAVNLPVLATSAGFLPASRPTAWTGRLFDAGHDQRADRVVVLGVGAARQLGISTLTGNPAVFIDDIAFTVIGILEDVERNTDLLSTVILPSHTAEQLWGPPQDASTTIMRIDTVLGGATTVADQVALALRPDDPALFTVVPPPDPRSLQDAVGSDLNALFLVLAGICLLIGTVGIANTTLVAVLERLPEIGLRRALGARPKHIAGQILTEAGAVGSLGGLIGTALGILAVVLVAVSRQWTPLVDPWVILPAPLLGTLTGVIAGLYPAMRAARVEPVQALQR